MQSLELPLSPEAAWYSRLPECTLPFDQSQLVGVFCVLGGLSPNVSDWRCGDVIVSKPLSHTLNPVVAYQRMVATSAAEWSHVGIYNGRGYIWDANPSVNVQERAVGDFLVARRTVAVLRPNAAAISEEDLYGVLREFVGSRYDVMAHKEMLIRRVFEQWTPESFKIEEVSNLLICTTFVERVLRHAFLIQPFKDVILPLPADFMTSKHFSSIPLQWKRRSI